MESHSGPTRNSCRPGSRALGTLPALDPLRFAAVLARGQESAPRIAQIAPSNFVKTEHHKAVRFRSQHLVGKADGWDALIKGIIDVCLFAAPQARRPEHTKHFGKGC